MDEPMQPIDAYGILKLDASATAEDIRRAYHQAARDHHPDRRKAGESDMHFIQVQRAWEALREPDARRQYDAQKRLETMLEEQALASLSDVTLDDMTCAASTYIMTALGCCFFERVRNSEILAHQCFSPEARLSAQAYTRSKW